MCGLDFIKKRKENKKEEERKKGPHFPLEFWKLQLGNIGGVPGSIGLSQRPQGNKAFTMANDTASLTSFLTTQAIWTKVKNVQTGALSLQPLRH